MNSMYYVYILRCADDTLYTGWTTDVTKRVKTHNSGKGAKYTRARLPVELVYTEEFDDKIEAQKREYAIKQLTRAEKEKLMEKREQSYKKTLSPGGFDSIRAEVEGLEAIRQTGCIRVPKVIDYGVNDREAYLVTEYISHGRGGRASSEKLGMQLANMHMHDASSFVSGGKYGFTSDNFIGASPQLNSSEDSWVKFFAEKRLRPQMEWAAHFFTADEIRNMEGLIEHLDKYLPEPERASLLHGDLWAGNYLITDNGDPVLIDPAVYVGHAEADLAMTELFGGFNSYFYGAYNEVTRIDSGYKDRRDLYNLYHMLNHLIIFGSGYLQSVRSIMRKYT